MGGLDFVVYYGWNSEWRSYVLENHPSELSTPLAEWYTPPFNRIAEVRVSLRIWGSYAFSMELQVLQLDTWGWQS